MGQRFVLNVIKTDDKGDDKVLFSIYQHWGAYTDNEIEVICKLISVYDKDDNLETLLKKTIETIPGSGVYFPEDCPGNTDAILELLEKGFHIAQDRNAGLIGVTPELKDQFNEIAEDVQNLYLDADNFLEDELWYISKDETDEDETPVALPSLFTTPVTKENALDLLARFNALDDEVFTLDENGYLYVVTC